MLGRFTVRPADDGSGTFGVWDGAVHGWRATGLSDEAEAHQVATDLDIQYDARGPRPGDAVSWVRPAPQPVERAIWKPAGVLDVWIRDADGQWLGRVRDDQGRVRWVPGRELRPAKEAS